MPHRACGFDPATARAYLTRRVRALAVWMRRLAPLPAPPGWRHPFDPVDALARAILDEQPGGNAAAAWRVADADTGVAAPTPRSQD